MLVVKKKESDAVFKRFTNGCVRVVNRWLPDAFLFAIILTIITFIGSLLATKMSVIEVLSAWGDQKSGLLGPAELFHADGPSAGFRFCHGIRPPLQEGAARCGRSVPQQ